MLFNSFAYSVLLFACVALYWLIPNQRARLVVLLIGSLVFYMSWVPIYIVLLLALVCFNVAACQISISSGRSTAITISVILDLGVLALFKYADFITQVGVDLFSPLMGELSFTQWNLILPLGISFYTFQLIGYIVDVRRGTVPPERNPLVVVVFVLFFPQLIAGPICRAAELMPQLKRKQGFRADRFYQGLLLFAGGLFLKVAIADNISPYTDAVYGNAEASGSADAFLGTLAFGIVIFCDFWGYSTMAVGSALLFGISVPANFNLPYIATSLQDFWRRWHITLSFWLRDYLYKPLGGSRHGKLNTSRNLMIVMVLGGLWHGAAYTFIIWGMIHGAWLVFERWFTGVWARNVSYQSTLADFIGKLLGWTITMGVVFFAWIFFRADSLSDAHAIVHQILLGPWAQSGLSGATKGLAKTALLFIGVFTVIHIPLHWAQNGNGAVLLSNPARAIVAFWLLTWAIILGSSDVQPFIYFQF